ncbi:MAG TPA: 50S ribosomal protein L25 [bacterium]|jgi:large subunit ribosomal protein L25
MERVQLSARRREDVGKNAVRRLRRNGQVPAVVYGRGLEALPVMVDGKALRGALHTHAGLNVLIDLALGDGDRAAQTVMVKDLQRDIFSRETITHVDFHTIDLTETIEAHVPLTFSGTPKGVTEGGVLEIHLRDLLVECLPTEIPESIGVDVSELTIGHALHVSDLRLPSKLTVLSSAGEVVALVTTPKVIEEAAPAAPAAEAPAAEVAAEAKPGAEKGKAPEAEEKEE